MSAEIYLEKMWSKLVEIAHFPIAWLGGLALFVADAVAGGRIIIYMVVISAIVDLLCGVAVAHRRKEFTLSELMRQSVDKLIVYGLALLVFFCIDAAVEQETDLQTNITSGLVGILITLTEVWSLTASLLILQPNNPLLKLLQKQLTGEIARKLGCEESEVSKILTASRRKKNQKRQGRNKKGQFTTKKKQ